MSQPQQAGAAPLRNLRVLDLGTMIAGPVAGTLLADFGAEVIKVEQPGSGDTLRGLGPFSKGESLWWTVDGRNKKSVTLDLRQPEGQSLLKKLAEKSDAVIENFRPGTMDKWGIPYAALAEINPKLVMLSVSGFGQTGPYATRAGYDRIGLAFSGVMGLTGYPDRPPVRAGVSIADYSTAVMGAFALMMALYHRDASGGRGQQIDLALYESMFRCTESLTAAYDQLGMVRQRTGNTHFGAAPGNTFETIDNRYLIVTISGDTLFRRFCKAMGQSQLADRPEYATHELRCQSVDVLNEAAANWIKSRPVAEISDALEQQGIPYSLVLSISDIVSNPQYVARENIVTVDHPRLGPVKMQGIVPKLSETPGVAIQPAPQIGQHNREIFMGLLEMNASRFDQLVAQKVI